jgi:hypothetical protein
MKGQVRLQTPFGARSVAFTKAGQAPLVRPAGRLPMPASSEHSDQPVNPE